MPISSLVVGDLGANCFIVSDGEAPDGLIIDPGGDADAIEAEIERLSLEPKMLFATHGHVDHISEAGSLKKRFPDMKFACLDLERDTLMRPTHNLSFFLGSAVEPPEPDVCVKDDEHVTVGSLDFTVIHVPGHTPGGAALFGEVDGGPVVFVGDALFAGSVGRSDFPGGNATELVEGIRSRLFVLPDDTRVFTGHGPETTIGREKRENPFVR